MRTYEVILDTLREEISRNGKVTLILGAVYAVSLIAWGCGLSSCLSALFLIPAGAAFAWFSVRSPITAVSVLFVPLILRELFRLIQSGFQNMEALMSLYMGMVIWITLSLAFLAFHDSDSEVA